MADPPLTNATLTTLAERGGSEDFDTPAGPGTPRWEGSRAVYIDERNLTETGELLTEGKRTFMIVDYDSIGSIAELGDSVVYNYAGDTGVVRRIDEMTHFPLAPLATSELRLGGD